MEEKVEKVDNLVHITSNLCAITKGKARKDILMDMVDKITKKKTMIITLTDCNCKGKR